jgi:hypothetical protein
MFISIIRSSFQSKELKILADGIDIRSKKAELENKKLIKQKGPSKAKNRKKKKLI